MVIERAVVLSVVGGTVAIALGIVVVVANQESVGVGVSSPGLTENQGTAVPTGTAPATVSQAREAGVALARLAVDPASLVASGAGPEALAGARIAVPAGSKVEVAESSWAPDGVGGMTVMVSVTPPEGVPVTYAAVMVREAGGWKVLATLPVASTPPPSTSGSTP